MSTAILSLRDRQRQLRQETILEVAHKLLAEKGFTAMTMDDVVHRVGIAKGSLYQHFKSKEELVSAVLISFMDRISTYIKELPSAQPAIERLKQTYRRALLVRFAEGFPDILNSERSVKEALNQEPAYQTSVSRLFEALGGLFDAAKKQGDITQDVPTEVLVYVTIGRVRAPELDPVIAAGRIESEELVEILIHMFLCGVVTDWQRSKMRRMPRS